MYMTNISKACNPPIFLCLPDCWLDVSMHPEDPATGHLNRLLGVLRLQGSALKVPRFLLHVFYAALPAYTVFIRIRLFCCKKTTRIIFLNYAVRYSYRNSKFCVPCFKPPLLTNLTSSLPFCPYQKDRCVKPRNIVPKQCSPSIPCLSRLPSFFIFMVFSAIISASVNVYRSHVGSFASSGRRLKSRSRLSFRDLVQMLGRRELNP
jgi:hypothetical protein